MILWMVLVAASLSSTDEPAAKPEPPAVTAGPNATEPKKRLQPRKDARGVDPAKPKAKRTASDENPTPEDDRPIPNPTDEKPTDELDDMLQRNLGQDLDAKRIEDEDPITKIAGQMRQSEELLARGAEEKKAIEIQEQIVRDLSQFLEDAQKQNSNSQPQKMRKMRMKKKPLDPEQLAQLERQRARMMQPAMRPNERGEPTGRIGPPKSAREKLAPQPEEKAVWGHLSEMLRSEMSQFAKENFLAKYRDLIERYYVDISRKSRGKGD